MTARVGLLQVQMLPLGGGLSVTHQLSHERRTCAALFSLICGLSRRVGRVSGEGFTESDGGMSPNQTPAVAPNWLVRMESTTRYVLRPPMMSARVHAMTCIINKSCRSCSDTRDRTDRQHKI